MTPTPGKNSNKNIPARTTHYYNIIDTILIIPRNPIATSNILNIIECAVPLNIETTLPNAGLFRRAASRGNGPSTGRRVNT